jgi:F-type H+-transporting ATPase subunit alpha
MQEILKQPQYEPMPLEHQVIVLFAGTNGYADNVPVEKMRKWEVEMLRYISSSHPELARDIAANQRITEENEKKLREALAAFQAAWQ